MTTITAVQSLLTEITKSYNEGKVAYPKSTVAVRHAGALYFLHSDAELVSDVFKKSLDNVSGVPVCIIDEKEHNDLAICLYENKVLMIIIDKEQTLMEKFDAIIRPYNDAILKGLNFNKIFGRE